MSILLTYGAASGGGAPPSGTVLYVGTAVGAWSFLIPIGVTSVYVEGWGGGGAGAPGSFTKSSETPGNGGGGGGYFRKNGISVTGGSTVLSGVIGMGGNASGGTGGGQTTDATDSCTAHGGAAGTASGAGAGGTATGGSVNTTGTNGGAVDVWDGGGSANGGVNQTAASMPGHAPGGGGAGGNGVQPAGNGAGGQIRITVT